MASRQTLSQIAQKKAADNQELVCNCWAGGHEITCDKLKKLSDGEVDAYTNRLTWDAEYTIKGKGKETPVIMFNYSFLNNKFLHEEN